MSSLDWISIRIRGQSGSDAIPDLVTSPDQMPLCLRCHHWVRRLLWDQPPLWTRCKHRIKILLFSWIIQANSCPYEYPPITAITTIAIASGLTDWGLNDPKTFSIGSHPVLNMSQSLICMIVGFLLSVGNTLNWTWTWCPNNTLVISIKCAQV